MQVILDLDSNYKFIQVSFYCLLCKTNDSDQIPSSQYFEQNFLQARGGCPWLPFTPTVLTS